jgi:hypothetical protein
VRVGFLRHNRYPGRIYMGDAGSLFLGVMLAVIGIRLEFATARRDRVFVPIVVLAVPILDTALVTVSRVVAGRQPVRGRIRPRQPPPGPPGAAGPRSPSGSSTEPRSSQLAGHRDVLLFVESAWRGERGLLALQDCGVGRTAPRAGRSW